MTAFAVPGYDVLGLLGFGSSGEVWLGRSTVDGQTVALKRLRTPGDLGARDRLRREAAVLAGIDHPHVVRLRTVVSAGEDLVLVLDHAAGGSLAGLLAARGPLDPGEVVTVVVPLAQALTAVHAQGVVHGDVSPANVLFHADGRPMLADLGVARLLGEPPDGAEGTDGFLDPAVLAGAAPVPASDVYGLAAVARAALGATRPRSAPRLTAALAAALQPEPARRPTAAELAVAVFDACPPTPVRLVGRPGVPAAAEPASDSALTHRVTPVRERPDRAGPTGAGRGRGARRRHPPAGGAPRRGRQVPASWRAVVAGLTLAGGLTAAVLVGVAWAGRTSPVAAPVRAVPSGSSTSGPAASGPAAALLGRAHATPAAWPDVLAALDRARSEAFAAADPTALAGVYAPRAPALARDRALLDRLVASGARTRGLRLEATSISATAVTGDRAVLTVTDVMPSYDLVAADGTVETRPGRGEVAWRVTLVRAGAGWRVFDVARA